MSPGSWKPRPHRRQRWATQACVKTTSTTCPHSRKLCKLVMSLIIEVVTAAAIRCVDADKLSIICQCTSTEVCRCWLSRLNKEGSQKPVASDQVPRTRCLSVCECTPACVCVHHCPADQFLLLSSSWRQHRTTVSYTGRHSTALAQPGTTFCTHPSSCKPTPACPGYTICPSPPAN